MNGLLRWQSLQYKAMVLLTQCLILQRYKRIAIKIIYNCV